MPEPTEQNRVKTTFRRLLLGSRWAMAPLCLGLTAALLIVLAQFFRELAHIIADFVEMADADVILAVLKLLDLVFVANLVILIISVAVELFMPQPPGVGDGNLYGIGTVDFARLKLKVIAAISAIAAIGLLEDFINIDQADKTGVGWEIAILLTFVLSGLLLASMDRLANAGE
jgi:uncharacterized protein (TIGR00645 family)